MHIIDQIQSSPSRFHTKFQRQLKSIAFASLTAMSVASAAKPVTTLAVPANHAELQYTGRVDFTDPLAPTLYRAKRGGDRLPGNRPAGKVDL